QPAVEASTSVASALVLASPLNDLTNLNFLLQQQQNQFMESLAKVALQQQEAIYSNSAISVEQPISTLPVIISDVGKHQQMLQKVKDPREKGRIWDTIVSNIQSSSIAGPVLKERSKTLIQQKWDALFQKYRDIKDTVAKFFYDIDEYLRSDPSVEVSITSDSIRGVKRKAQESEELNEDEHITSRKRKNKHIGEKENLIEEFQTLIKEQTTAIIKAIDYSTTNK
ncbi:2467_t:CDS:2, partial [Scutellospora calospora]